MVTLPGSGRAGDSGAHPVGVPGWSRGLGPGPPWEDLPLWLWEKDLATVRAVSVHGSMRICVSASVYECVHVSMCVSMCM